MLERNQWRQACGESIQMKANSLVETILQLVRAHSQRRRSIAPNRAVNDKGTDRQADRAQESCHLLDGLIDCAQGVSWRNCGAPIVVFVSFPTAFVCLSVCVRNIITPYRCFSFSLTLTLTQSALGRLVGQLLQPAGRPVG